MYFKNVLLLYKRSAYKIYFLDRKRPIAYPKNVLLRREITRFKEAHNHHYITLRTVSRLLLTYGVRYTECYRGRNIDYTKYDLIITVGGDGTFLEAARKVKNQTIIGVNSAPEYSVGRFCIANAKTFERILKKILKHKFHTQHLQRLRMKLDGHPQKIDALNDILICHRNPAVLCRYYLKIKQVMEHQRSSGVWISTPAGSSGAVGSAGGKIIGLDSQKIQYQPRELYSGNDRKYKLKGGILNSRQSIQIVSLMRDGMVYVDGAHHKFSFSYGSKLRVSLSPSPIKTIRL